MHKIKFIFLLVIFSTTAFAQPATEPSGNRANRTCPPTQQINRPQEHRERRMLEAVRITRMTEALDLTNDQMIKFLPKLKQLEDEQRDIRMKHRTMVIQLEGLMKKGSNEKEVKIKLDSIDNLRKESLINMEKIHQELDTLLTLQQRALWRVFDENFDKEIRKMVMQSREKSLREVKH
jgi:hypothetical protein